jgi:hypothetical protein
MPFAISELTSEVAIGSTHDANIGVTEEDTLRALHR